MAQHTSKIHFYPSSHYRWARGHFVDKQLGQVRQGGLTSTPCWRSSPCSLEGECSPQPTGEGQMFPVVLLLDRSRSPSSLMQQVNCRMATYLPTDIPGLDDCQGCGRGEGGFQGRREVGVLGLSYLCGEGTSHNSYGPWASFLKASLSLFHSKDALSPNRGQVRGGKEAGNTLRAAMLKGSYFVFLVGIRRFVSGGSRLLGWIVGKMSLSSLYPTPVCLLGLGIEEPLHLSDHSIGNVRG